MFINYNGDFIMTDLELYKKVNSAFYYNNKTDDLLWAVSLGNRKVGDIAGKPNNYGEIYITFIGKKYSKARLVFLMYNRYLPKRVLRKNADGGDRPCNIFDPDENIDKGYPHVKYDYNKCVWVANVDLNGIKYVLGDYKTQGRAIAVCEDKLATIENKIIIEPEKTPGFYVDPDRLVKRIKEIFTFNKKTCVFTAKENNPYYNPGKKLGSAVAGDNDTVVVDDVRYKRKHLVVLMLTGKMEQIIYNDYIGKNDPSEENLFTDISKKNCILHHDWRLNVWKAIIKIDGHEKYVGMFADKNEANDACLKEIKKYRKYQLTLKLNSD